MSTSRFGRLRGSARETRIRALLGRWSRSELSQAEFCRGEGMSEESLRLWRSEFAEPQAAPSGGGFVEVRLDRSPSARGLRLELGSGRCVELPPGFAAADLERVLDVVGRRPC